MADSAWPYADDATPVLDRLTAQMQAIRDRQIAVAADAPTRALDDWEGMREDYRIERAYWNDGGPDMASVDADVIATEAGTVPVRYYRPTTAPTAVDGAGMAEEGAGLPPVIVYTHGGGWIIGDLDTHDRIMRNLAHHTGAVVVGVDYSLSPEAKFPVPVNQCVGVIEHVVAQAADLGVDASTISFSGDSAGAYLALAATLALAGKESPISPSCLLLFYGIYGLEDSPARRLLGGPWDGMARADLEFYWGAYLGQPEDMRHPYVDCLSGDLTAVPPTYLAAAELDPAKDDSYTLAALLTRLGTPVELTTFNGVLHGFLHYTRALDEATEAFVQAAAFYRTHIRD
ncbi:MAG: alpha/beta hydrolase fold domain-containing protein [Cellulomonadaceae bacterium]|jgi:acetyl esterase|nr:alpha/beta hydrolase fold domain-containing protein [Cellulomonadaceae bacterium]